MQQLELFKMNLDHTIKRWNIILDITEILWDEYVAEITIPSWKFIVKYFYDGYDIISLEILDYMWYIYLWKWIIKTIKDLIKIMLKNN